MEFFQALKDSVDCTDILILEDKMRGEIQFRGRGTCGEKNLYLHIKE